MLEIIKSNVNIKPKILKTLVSLADASRVSQLEREREVTDNYKKGVGDPGRVVAKMEGRTKFKKNSKNKKLKVGKLDIEMLF